MPQQPFSSFPNAWTVMITVGTLPQKPESAAKMMNLIGAFALVEIEFGVLFADFLGIDAPLGTELYSELIAEAPQNALFGVAVRRAQLDKELSTMLAVMVKWRKSCSSVRKDFAHSSFGECPEIPDSILVVSPRRTISEAAAQAKVSAEMDEYWERKRRGEEPQQLRHRISYLDS